jgi:heme/copper-type cytochrome/quinol oxidase subunit 4
MEKNMSNQISQEELDRETDALIIQMNRAQRFNYLKFGAAVLLTLIALFTVVYVTATIPATVVGLLGQ